MRTNYRDWLARHFTDCCLAPLLHHIDLHGKLKLWYLQQHLVVEVFIYLFMLLNWLLVTAITTWYGKVMRCTLLTGNTTASNTTCTNIIPKEEISPTPLWSLSSCCSSAGCRSASAAGGWFPATVRSSLWVGRCAADNPGLNPKGWNRHVETGGGKTTKENSTHLS